MMKYLDAVENSVSGDDLAQIRRMLKYTSKSVTHHSKAYTNIKSEVETMNKDASDALTNVSRHNDDIQRMLLQSEQSRRKLETKVAIPEAQDEEDDDDDYSKTNGISTAAEPKLDVSLQKQKEDIVEKLVGMNDNMRSFAGQV